MFGQQVLDADLPVAGNVGGKRAAVGLGDAAQFGQRRGLAKGEQHQARHVAHRQRRQVVRRRRAVLGRDRRRRAQELALQIVGPAMEAAAQGLAVARRGTHHLHVLVPAGVAQDPHRALPVAHGHDAPTTHGGGEEVARLFDLPFGAERQPFARKQRPFLGLEGVALGILVRLHLYTFPNNCAPVDPYGLTGLGDIVYNFRPIEKDGLPWPRVRFVWLSRRRSNSVIRPSIPGARPGPRASSTAACWASGSSSTTTMSAISRNGWARSTPPARTGTCSTSCWRTSPRRKASSARATSRRCAIPSCCWSLLEPAA